MIRTRLTFLLLLAGSPALEAAQPGARIAPEQIRAAVLARFPDLGSVRPLVEPVARTADPELIAGNIEQWGSSGLRVRVSCRLADQCVPFYVAVAHRGGQDPLGASAAARAGREQGAGEQDNFAGTHAGDTITLRMDSGPLHVTVPVKVLTSAPVGAQVRVEYHPAPLTADSRPPAPRLLLATVIDRNTVKGNLP